MGWIEDDDIWRRRSAILAEGNTAQLPKDRFRLYRVEDGRITPNDADSLFALPLNFVIPQGLVSQLPNADAVERLTGLFPGLLSGLVCAGANEPVAADGADGYLTAEEVGWIDLSDVDLVVLSACQTVLGRTTTGEGLMGLRRAFRLAGAQTVIASLWSVSDEATAQLMADFYAFPIPRCQRLA